ncbi:hypothetical protein EFER_1307 [Escherichia fergusonii ATCC 35469]|uniref:Uncharacterized protein n=1 Tax=Escherichia fergusonii (strain ATCC 35469 / DSM 13698 / CCUG 18766 / IAM 14443 / JCM 21226 / LMG 7866 / NBRC 102419 / NCTC 12128 / CDC 0568-73) TaxID=585054 RepID=B7LQ34_ESCF3|nr:hypothetical protein EFER_1307 [Escherichia fergusonii ATCC 35469]
MDEDDGLTRAFLKHKTLLIGQMSRSYKADDKHKIARCATLISLYMISAIC